jgi:hypothetical protein
MGLLLLMGGSERKLLDQYTAAVGFSLRKLRTAYSGSAIRVRRSSDSAEQDIGFSGNTLDTASLLSFCGAGDGFVTTWYDQVGSNNATQTTAGNQPQIVSSGSLIVSETNKPAISLVDASGATIGQYLEYDPFFVNTQSYVGVLVSYSLVDAGFSGYVLGSNPSDRGVVHLHFGATRQPLFASIRTSGNNTFGAALALNTTHVFFLQTDRTRVSQFLNTTAAEYAGVADQNANFSMPTKCWIGQINNGTPTCNNKVSEIIGFITDQSSNQLAIRTNASNYWRS